VKSARLLERLANYRRWLASALETVEQRANAAWATSMRKRANGFKN
jgi:hypothetical protein